MNYVELVEDVNQKLYEAIPPEEESDIMSFIEENPLLELKSCGFAHVITCFGISIWCSEDDERPYVPCNGAEEERQIPLEEWLWSEVKRVLLVMGALGKRIGYVKRDSPFNNELQSEDSS